MRAGCRATRRLKRPERRRRARRALLLTFLVAAAALGALRLARPAASSLGRLPVFQVRRIEVAGNRHLSGDEVRAAARVPEGANLLLLDPGAVAAAVRSNPRIERARVARAPGMLAIEVREREPFLLVNAGTLLELDAAGTILPRLKSGRVADRPVLSGLSLPTRSPGARVLTAAFRDVLRLAAELDAPDVRLLDEIAEIVAVDPRRVVLRTSPDQIPILVDPSRTSRSALHALAATLRDVRARDQRVLCVDARFRGQVVVRSAPDSLGARAPAEKV